MRPAKARLCVYGAVYRRYAVHRLDHRPCRPPARTPERTRRKVHPCQRGLGDFAYLELCADKRAALRREYALKQLPKAQKELLCAAWTAAGGPFAGA